VLQPIGAFVYCNCHAAAGRRRQTSQKFPRTCCATNSAHGRVFAKIILWWNHAWNRI